LHLLPRRICNAAFCSTTTFAQEYQWLSHATFILFLNKVDLFREKIKMADISKHFPDYKGTVILHAVPEQGGPLQGEDQDGQHQQALL
jgi:hypothetical protein